MLAMCGPTGIAAYFVGRASERFRGKIWHSAVSRGLVPVTIGLTAASATVIATTADYGWTAAAVTAVTAIICYFVRINPIWVFACAAVLGLGRSGLDDPQRMTGSCAAFAGGAFAGKLVKSDSAGTGQCANIST